MRGIEAKKSIKEQNGSSGAKKERISQIQSFFKDNCKINKKEGEVRARGNSDQNKKAKKYAKISQANTILKEI